MQDPLPNRWGRPLYTVGTMWAALPHALIMTSSTPTSKSGQRPPAMAIPVRQKPWWRRWLEPIVPVTIIIALLTALVTGGVAVFQSVKGDINTAEARLHEEVRISEARLYKEIQASEGRLHEEIQTSEARLHEEIHASEARLSEEIQASEARQNKRTDEVKEEIKDVRAEIKDLRAEIKDLRTELKQDNAELRAEFKADMSAMDNKLDQVLEVLLTAKS